MDDDEIALLLCSEITDDMAENSDIGGDSDAEDDLPRTVPDSSRTRSETSIVSTSTLGDVPICSASNPLWCEPSTSKGLPSSNGLGLQRKRKTPPVDFKTMPDSDSSPVDDSDEDPTFVVDYDEKARYKKQKQRFPLFVFSDASTDTESEPEGNIEQQSLPDKQITSDHTYSSPVKSKPKNKKKKVRPITKVRRKMQEGKKKTKEKKYKWAKNSAQPNQFSDYKYNQKFGLNINLESDDPTTVFKTIFDEEICNLIVEESNLFAIQNNNQLELTVEELYAFIGILIFMGFHVLPSIRQYWSEDENFHVERVARVMSVKRFLKILRFLHLNDNLKMPPRGAPDFDKLYKVRPLLNHLKTKYMVLFSPSRNLSIDESMVGFKGRSSLKQYMPKKPIKRGFKIWVCACSETGFVLSFDVYTGKQSDGSSVERLGEKVVLQVAAPFIGLGHCLFFDNFFTSVELVKTLADDNTFSCGTILPTRVEYPEEMKRDKDIKTHDYDFAQCGDLSVVKWMDRGKKSVSVISSMHNPADMTTVQRTNNKGQRETVPCPKAIATYNKYMGGVDRFDQHMSNYSIVQKSRRWWIKLFYYFLDSSVVNSYIMYSFECKNTKNKNKKPMTHLKFRSMLVNGLIGRFCSKKRPGYSPGSGKARKRNNPAGRSTIDNTVRLTNVGAHLPEKIAKYRRCAHCSTKKKEKRSNMMCPTCNVALCKQCFLPFHTS